eukprot:Tamp_13035.p1 GENE.Tamp_13035~~Tamp_13035.p1  ORF type:complete len:526 (+),score=102.74 Tamp_13035:73-1578(+)
MMAPMMQGAHMGMMPSGGSPMMMPSGGSPMMAPMMPGISVGMPQMLPAGQHFPGAGVATATSGVSPKLVPRSGNSPQPQRPDLVLNQMGQVSKLQTVGGGLDSNFATTDKGQTVAGVGIFFQQDAGATVYVADIVPDSSAEACGRIQRDDILHSIGNMEIFPGHTLEEVRSRILGPLGTTVRMSFRRPGGQYGTGPRNEMHFFDVELERGRPGTVGLQRTAAAMQRSAPPPPPPQQDAYAEVMELRQELLSLQRTSRGESSSMQELNDPRVASLEADLTAKMQEIKRFEEVLMEAQMTANQLDKEKLDLEMKITEVQLDNERMISRERERTAALQDLQHRNTHEILQIQTAQDTLQLTLVEERSRREAAEKHYQAITQEIQALKAADEDQKEEGAIKHKLRSAHASLEQALISQESHLHALLEVLPALDTVHTNLLQAGSGNLRGEQNNPYQRARVWEDTPSLGQSIGSMRSSFSRDNTGGERITTTNQQGKIVQSVIEYA